MLRPCRVCSLRLKDAGNEKRRLEAAAANARVALSDARRVHAAEKDALLVSAEEAEHRAKVAEAEASDAKVIAGAYLALRWSRGMRRWRSLDALSATRLSCDSFMPGTAGSRATERKKRHRNNNKNEIRASFYQRSV